MTRDSWEEAWGTPGKKKPPSIKHVRKVKRVSKWLVLSAKLSR